MGDRPAWKNEYTLLCERCGYVIEGLPTAGACPECSKPIQESLPERRRGSVWQRAPKRNNLIRAWIDTSKSPLKTLDQIQPQRRAKNLRDASFDTSATICTLGLALTLLITALQSKPTVSGDTLAVGTVMLLMTFLLWLIIYTALYGLTAVEQRGLTLLAKRHGFRVDRTAAATICDHGSVGWVLSSIGIFVFGITLVILDTTSKRPMGFLAWSLVPAAALPGFLFFEVFAWLGLRRLKFANSTNQNVPEVLSEPLN